MSGGTSAEPEEFNLIGAYTNAISGSTGCDIGTFSMSHNYDQIYISSFNNYSVVYSSWMIASLTRTYLPITITDSSYHTIAEFTYNQGSYYIPLIIYAYRSSNVVYMRLEISSTVSIPSSASSDISISVKCKASNI